MQVGVVDQGQLLPLHVEGACVREDSEASTQANQKRTEGKIVLVAPRPW